MAAGPGILFRKLLNLGFLLISLFILIQSRTGGVAAWTQLKSALQKAPPLPPALEVALQTARSVLPPALEAGQRRPPPPPPAPAPPIFERTFDVRNAVAGTYHSLIQRLRNKLQSSTLESGSVPVLRPEVDKSERQLIEWFHVVLAAREHNVTVRIRADNLYLYGYRVGWGGDTEHPPGPWFELTKNASDLFIPGAQILGYDGSYRSMMRSAGSGTTTLGKEALTGAVSTLANAPRYSLDLAGREAEVARSLLQVIVMICEATRFRDIEKRMSRTFPTDEFKPGGPSVPLQPGGEILSICRSWEDLSDFLQSKDKTLPQPNALGIQTRQQAIRKAGILKHCKGGKDSKVLAPVGVDDSCSLGRPFMEVFSVIFNNVVDDFSAGPGASIYGSITATDGLGPQLIYNRESNDGEGVMSTWPAITLNGPSRHISALRGRITITVRLVDADPVGRDVIVADGGFAWGRDSDVGQVYDRPLRGEIAGDRLLFCPSVTVNYIVFSEAVRAKVRLTVANGPNRREEYAFGQVVAGLGNRFAVDSVLFNRTSCPVTVKHGEDLRLSRSAVAVPLMNSFLHVRAHLYSYHGSNERQIASGSASFRPRTSGTSHMRILGRDGAVRVEVTWG